MKLSFLLAGTIASLGTRQSAIAKKPIEGRQYVGFNGLIVDEQADKRHHGGLEKAIHHYPYEHYALWQKDIGFKDILQKPGAFGENFSTLGMDETTVAVGDVFRVGEVLVEVSQGRQPCATLNERFNIADMAKQVQSNGRAGWYYRILEEGYVASGDEIILVDRRSPEWTLNKIWHYFYNDRLNYDALEQIAQIECLSLNWRERAQKRLKNRNVEDWSKRLGS